MVVDVEFLGQLVDSMEQAVLKLEEALEKKNAEDAAKLRTFIFDIHRQIDSAISGGKNA